MYAITTENFLLHVDKIPVTDEQKQSLLDLVDCSCLSECTLQRAYTSELVPQTHVTKAALELCGRLRHELDDAKQVIRYQEAELDKYGLGAKYRTGEYPMSIELVGEMVETGRKKESEGERGRNEVV